MVHTGWRWCRLKCCFTSTETVGLLGTGAQNGHLDFHTASELWDDDDDDDNDDDDDDDDNASSRAVLFSLCQA